MRTLIAAAVGALGGYALARAVEARAHGLPVSEALTHWLDPVATLKVDWLARQQQPLPPWDPDAPMPPSFLGLRAMGDDDDE